MGNSRYFIYFQVLDQIHGFAGNRVSPFRPIVEKTHIQLNLNTYFKIAHGQLRICGFSDSSQTLPARN